jgi:hypothetical protein
VYPRIVRCSYLNDDSEADQQLDWRVGLMFLCFNRFSEDGIPVRKHVGVDTMNHILRFVVYRVDLLVNIRI